MSFCGHPAVLHRAAAGHTFLHEQKSMQKTRSRGGIAVSPLRIPLGAKGDRGPLWNPRSLARLPACGGCAAHFLTSAKKPRRYYNSWRLRRRRVVMPCSSPPERQINSNHFWGSFAAPKILIAEAVCLARLRRARRAVRSAASSLKGKSHRDFPFNEISMLRPSTPCASPACRRRGTRRPGAPD